jgi:hypothetical protein
VKERTGDYIGMERMHETRRAGGGKNRLQEGIEVELHDPCRTSKNTFLPTIEWKLTLNSNRTLNALKDLCKRQGSSAYSDAQWHSAW